MLNFKEHTTTNEDLKFINLLPSKIRHSIKRYAHQDKYKGALAMYHELKKNKDIKSRNLSDKRIKSIAADFFKLSHREFEKILDRKTRYEAVEDWQVNEAPLGPGELSGVNHDTGELRVEILKKLIKKGTPIKMVPGKGHKNDLFTVTDKKLALNGLDQFTRDGKSFSIGTHDGKNVISSHIFKSKIFGGETGGAGPGTKATADTESAQALWCAAVTKEGKKTYEYFTNEILSKHTNRAFTGGTNLKTMLGIPEDWRKSAYLSAVVLLDNKFINKGMTFHRDDLKMNDIYAKKKDAYRNNDMKNLNNDKWNPGDIWALSKEFNAENIPIDAVRSLNVYMLEEYLARRIVGISLKIIDNGTGTFKEYNKQVPVPTDDYKLDKMLVKGEKRGTFWSSKRGSITSKEGMYLQVAANKSFGTMKIEISGKGARGGGMGYGPIEDSIEIVKLPKLESQSNLIATAKLIADPGKRGKISTKTMKARKDFHKRISKFEKMTRKTFDEEIAKKDASWIHAKLGVITILEAFNNASAIKANRLITRMINYAASKSEDASVYVKVSN
jgi:hypothetical protein